MMRTLTHHALAFALRYLMMFAKVAVEQQ
jgi:hypothetical protein